MRRILCIITLAAIVLWPAASVRPYSLQFTNGSASVQLKWPSNVITIAFSTSLNSPPPNIKAGSDVVGAARRALARWSEAGDITFVETTSNEQLVGNDGVNLITVGVGNSFSTTEQPGRARLSFNTATGAISDADVAINSALFAVGGGPGFSTDGTPGTYDLESTFAHEIGHLLGLEHSGVVGATMQPRQGRNGLYDLPALTTRTISHDDRAGIRSIYGPTSGTGAIAGTITYAGSTPAFGAHVWAEDVTTGRAMSSNIALADGRFRIEGLPPGQYRVIAEYLNEPVSISEIASRNGGYSGLITTSTIPFATTEVATAVGVAANAATTLNITASAAQPFVNPTLIGTNNQLSTIGVPLVPGSSTTILVGGDNVHQIAASGISVTSPFITVDPASVSQLAFGQTQVVSFRVSVAITAPPGEYSLRFSSGSGEFAYISGGLTVDLPNGVVSGNPSSDNRFFVAQQYRDFLNREPDAGGFANWTGVLEGCGTNQGGLGSPATCDRVHVSSGFYRSTEFGERGYFVYRFFEASLGRLPRYAEFVRDLQRISGVQTPEEHEASKAAFIADFMGRPEFVAKYAGLTTTGNASQFIAKLEETAGTVLPETVPPTLTGQPLQLTRTQLINKMASGEYTPAQTLRAFVEQKVVFDKFFYRGFVAMQYFGYLRRDPETAGYNDWVDVLTNGRGTIQPGDYRHLIFGFVYAAEYRARFGQP